MAYGDPLEPRACACASIEYRRCTAAASSRPGCWCVLDNTSAVTAAPRVSVAFVRRRRASSVLVALSRRRRVHPSCGRDAFLSRRERVPCGSLMVLPRVV
jgi:hypothetical protein